MFPSDLLNYYVPRGEAVAQRLLHGELPLWNPRLCGGIPELATAQTAVLSPQTWLFAPLPAELALPLRVFAECLLGGFFAVLWLRRLGLDVPAGALGGALYLAACLLGQSLWPPVVSTLLWLPALLACIESLAQRWRWRAWLALVACVALQSLAGFPQFALYSLQGAGVYALARALALRGASAAALRVLAGLVAAFALGLGVAGAQLLPTAELAGQSTRAQTLTAKDLHYLGETTSIGVALRNAVDPAAKGLAFDYPKGGNYLGIATLLLFVVGAALGPPRLVWPLCALGALALLLSGGLLGPGAPLYRAYLWLPAGSFFRIPERLRIWTLVAAIGVAAVGLDRVGRGRDGLSRARLLAGATAVGAAAAGIALFGAEGAAPRAGVALLLLGVAASLRQATARRVAQALLLLLAVGDLWWATAPTGSLRSSSHAWVESFQIFGHRILGAEGFAALRERAGWQRVEIERALPSTGAGPIAAADRLDCLEPLAPRVWRELLRDLPLSQRTTLYDVAGVALLVRPRRIDLRPDALQVPYAEFHRRFFGGLDPAPYPPPAFSVDLMAMPDALPRAYWIEAYTLVTPEQAREQVARGDFDFHRAVLLERDPGVPVAADPAPLRAAAISSYAPERVEIEVDAPRDGWLVLSDAWYPGWRATRDGVELEILRANAVFRAVRVPAGRSQVVFAYRPQSLRLGFALSGLSLATALAVPATARRIERRRRTASA